MDKGTSDANMINYSAEHLFGIQTDYRHQHLTSSYIQSIQVHVVLCSVLSMSHIT